jgi:hypothetical protein
MRRSGGGEDEKRESNAEKRNEKSINRGGVGRGNPVDSF